MADTEAAQKRATESAQERAAKLARVTAEPRITTAAPTGGGFGFILFGALVVGCAFAATVAIAPFYLLIGQPWLAVSELTAGHLVTTVVVSLTLAVACVPLWRTHRALPRWFSGVLAVSAAALMAATVTDPGAESSIGPPLHGMAMGVSALVGIWTVSFAAYTHRRTSGTTVSPPNLGWEQDPVPQGQPTAATTANGTTAGWHQDPWSGTQFRWFDGNTWTGHTAPK